MDFILNIIKIHTDYLAHIATFACKLNYECEEKLANYFSGIFLESSLRSLTFENLH